MVNWLFQRREVRAMVDEEVIVPEDEPQEEPDEAETGEGVEPEDEPA